MSDDLRKLKDEAARAAEKGKHRRAAELYAAIGVREDDPQWPQRAGDALKRAGAPLESLAHYMAAADGYARHGFLLKAIAMAKQILQIDPKHAKTQGMLAALYARQRTPGSSPPPAPVMGVRTASRPPTEIGLTPHQPSAADAKPRAVADAGSLFEATPGAVAEFAEVELTPLPVLPIKPGASVDTLPLASVMPGAHSTTRFTAAAANAPKIYEIPLEEVEEIDEGDLELEVGVVPPPLPQIPLFSSLDEYHLRRLIEKVRIVEHEADAVLMREGEVDDRMYVIVRGEVEVSIAGKALNRLGEGQFFGELAVITDGPRSASVRSTAPTQLLEMDRKVITSLIKDDPEVLRTLLRFCRDRLIDLLVHTSPLFDSFSPDDARSLANRFRFLELEAGGLLLSEGERSSGLFVILSGHADAVTRNTPIDSLGPGAVCGVVSMLARSPSLATVIARTKIWALGLSRQDFQELAVTYPQVLAYLGELAEGRRERVAAVRR